MSFREHCQLGHVPPYLCVRQHQHASVAQVHSHVFGCIWFVYRHLLLHLPCRNPSRQTGKITRLTAHFQHNRANYPQVFFQHARVNIFTTRLRLRPTGSLLRFLLVSERKAVLNPLSNKSLIGSPCHADANGRKSSNCPQRSWRDHRYADHGPRYIDVRHLNGIHISQNYIVSATTHQASGSRERQWRLVCGGRLLYALQRPLNRGTRHV